MLDLDVPGGTIVPNELSVEAVDDLGQAYALAVATEVYHCAALGMDMDCDWPEIRLRVGGVETSKYSIYVLDLWNRIFCVRWGGSDETNRTFMVFRGNRQDSKTWMVGTELLLLPWEYIRDALVDGLLLMFAGRLVANDSLRPL
jgi:hypothetical protein